MSISLSKKMFSFSLLERSGAGQAAKAVKYPGVRDAVDGNTAVIHVEREASDAAGAYPNLQQHAPAIVLHFLDAAFRANTAI